MILLTSSLVFTACTYNPCECEADAEILLENDSMITHFITDPSQQAYHVNYWKKFDEPPIYRQEYETYRFSIRTTFEEYMKIYRVQQTISHYEVVIKEYAIDNFGHGRPDSLVSSEVYEITSAEWTTFIDTLNNNCFWTMETHHKGERVLDGSTLLVEAFKPGGNNCTSKDFHAVMRETGFEDEFIAVCKAFYEFDPLVIKEF